MALTTFYIFLIIFGWAAVAVAGIGFFEQWAELRGKFNASPPDGNDDSDDDDE